MFPRRRLTPRLPAAAPAAAFPIPALQEKPMALVATKNSQYQDVDTQPLWFRARVAGNQTLGARTSLDLFTARKNASPHLTNAEEAGSMPNSAEFFISGLELVKQPTMAQAAFDKLLANGRLVLEVGTKNFEKVNQPAALFAGVDSVVATSIKRKLYLLKPGEEIHLAADQPYRVRLEMDDDGMALALGEDLDFLCLLHGQKRSKVSVG